MKAKKAKRRTVKNKTTKKRKPAAKLPTIIEVLAAANFIIDGTARFMWSSFGRNARYIDLYVPPKDGKRVAEACAIVDVKTSVVYDIHVCDYNQPPKKQAYRWLNPNYRDAYRAEAAARGNIGVRADFAWDAEPWNNVSGEAALRKIRELCGTNSGNKDLRWRRL